MVLIVATADDFDAEASYADAGRPSHDTYKVAGPGHAVALSEEISHPAEEPDQNHLWIFSPENQVNVASSQPYHDFSPFGTVGMQQERPLQFMPVYSPGIQQVRSIETLDHFNVQLCGTSAELDPWLLRHCKFDELGIGFHGKIKLRNVGGVPINNIVPVHFTVVEDGVYEPIDPGKRSTISPDIRRQELNALISPEQGLRLLSL